MGFISEMAGQSKGTFPGQEMGKVTWRRVFGQTHKEEGQGQRQKPVPGGSFGRSIASAPNAYKHLLQAMRTFAPGGWTQDPWEQAKHFKSVTYVAIHRIATQLSQAEFQLFRKDDSHPEGKVPVTPYDPPEGDRQCKPYDLVKLLEKPNKHDSFGKLMYRLCQNKYLFGTSLTWMVPNMLGDPMELYSIPYPFAIPQPAVNPDFPEGYYRIQPVYPYGPFSSYPIPSSVVGAPIPSQWMIRMMFPHPLLRYEGYSPQTGMSQQLDEIEGIDRSRTYSMRRSINPSAVLNFTEMEGIEPLPEPEIDRIRAEWENEFQGPENAGKLIIGTPGGTLDEWGSKPVDMDYQQGWDQLVSFALGGYGITKPAAGMVEDSSYQTLFATLKQFVLITLDPECNDTASDLTKQLCPFFGDDLILEIRCKKINDHEINFTKVDKCIQAKCATKNEVRVLLELPVTKEEWGSEIAGFEKPPEQPGGAMGGMPGMPQSGQEEQGNEADEVLQGDEDEQANESAAPDAGTLSEGALGPQMKSLRLQKLRNRYRRCLVPSTNGYHRG